MAATSNATTDAAPARSPRPAAGARAGEAFTIRRKVMQLAGASFHVYDASGGLVAYCKQKAFKLREDIRLFTDESMATPLLSMKARTIMDFSTTYDVLLPSGDSLGSLRRKGITSSLVQDHWLVFDAAGNQVAEIKERGAWLSFFRRVNDLVAALSPQTFDLTRAGTGENIASFRQHFNLLVSRMGVTIHQADDHLDDLLILASACLIAAIEGRQG